MALQTPEVHVLDEHARRRSENLQSAVVKLKKQVSVYLQVHSRNFHSTLNNII